MYTKDDLQEAFRAGWMQGLDDVTEVQELFRDWYEQFTGERPVAPLSRRKGW